MKRTSADGLIVRTMRAGWGWNTALLALNLGQAAGALLMPWALARAVDEQLGGTGNAATAWFGALLGLLLLAEVSLHLVAPWCTNTLTFGLRRDLLSRALHLERPERAGHTPGDLTSRVLSSTAETASVVPTAVAWVSSVLVSGGALVALLAIDPWLAAAFVAGAPLTYVLIRSFIGRISPLLTQRLAIQGAIANRLIEVLAGIRTVRAAGAEPDETARVLGDLPELHRIGLRTWRLQGTLNMQASMLMPLTQTAVIAAAGYMLSRGGISPGQLTAAVGYVGMALGLFRQADTLTALARARAGAVRVDEVMSARRSGSGGRELPDGRGAVDFDRVSVAGPDGPLLDGVDLRLPGGSLVAVVGRSGSGKSTLAAVAGRLLDPDGGEVRLDGVPVRELSPQALGTAVSWAFERPTYLPGTVGEAIRLGSGGVGDARMHGAMAGARAAEFVERLPDGYATPCEEAALSGGERQRLGLARALDHGGRLYVFDDAVSSVDSVTELHIGRTLRAELEGTTRLMVTHRVSMAARADLVVWLERGRVRAFAPHRDLWERSEYRRLFGRSELREDPGHAR